MAVCSLLLAVIALFAPNFMASFLPALSQSDKAAKPGFTFSWLDDNNTFRAGDIATIKINILGEFDSGLNLTFDKPALNLTITVNGKMGNSSYISGVSSNFEGNLSTWSITFVPIWVGVFNVLVNDDQFGILDSTLHFQVTPGHLYPSACVCSWMGPVNEFVAGAKSTVLVLPKDAFGNNISSSAEEVNSYNFTVCAFYANGSLASFPRVTYMGSNQLGYFSIEFIASLAGSLLLQVDGGNQTLYGSPLPFNVNPGPLDVSSCEAEWNLGTNALQIFSKMEILVHQKDQYGNLVPGLNPFDAQVVEMGTNLAIPVADLHFEEVLPGTQLFTSSMLEPGKFLLTIFDMKQNKSISKMPYEFTVFVGYCDGLNSVINGSGLASSVAGEVAKFSVYLNDIYQYPSPVELERLQVQIIREVDAYRIWPTIYPMQTVNGSVPAGQQRHGAIGHTGIAPEPYSGSSNTSGDGLQVQASAFDVIFTPENSGIYEIRLFCGNIPLNGGHPFTKEVRSGEVDLSLSGVIRFAAKVPKLVKNEIVVQLLDSFANAVLSQESSLKLEIGSINSSGFQTWLFLDNNNGSYIGHFMAKEVGTYKLCASFNGKHLSPCPFGINVYSSEYFPKALDDMISLWEDESIAFDALANDFFAGGRASIDETSKPIHGSLLQYGQLFRYTPYKGFSGNDTFSYTISDVNGNLATATVYISVLSIPPQFVSFPSGLQAIEDMISPQFGGFPSFALRYSDLLENISVTVRANFGTIFLSPMPMQFGKPMQSGLCITKRDGEAKDLVLEGTVEEINSALHSLQYLGDENFYGDDTIILSTMNRNGVNELKVPIFVEPINDPPYFHVPRFIILKSDGDESLIFDREKDKFDFYVGDPDVVHFPGGESRFLVICDIEVNSGFLVTSLPAEIINTTELKVKSSYRWQPLQTFVTISKHVMVKAEGIRFRGTVNDCNSIMQQLFYHGGEHGAVLTVTINDLGNYGCHPDCVEKISKPLYAEASVNLIKRSPMSSITAHTLGSAIVIELVVVFSLGMVLLFFTCKCAVVLVNERRDRNKKNSSPLRAQSLHEQFSATNMSGKENDITGHRSNPFLFIGQPSNFRQRSRRQSESGESSEDVHQSRPSSSDSHQQTPSRSIMPVAIEKEKSEMVA